MTSKIQAIIAAVLTGIAVAALLILAAFAGCGDSRPPQPDAAHYWSDDEQRWKYSTSGSVGGQFAGGN